MEHVFILFILAAKYSSRITGEVKRRKAIDLIGTSEEEWSQLKFLIWFLNCVPLFGRNMMSLFNVCLTSQDRFRSRRLKSGIFHGWICFVKDLLISVARIAERILLLKHPDVVQCLISCWNVSRRITFR